MMTAILSIIVPVALWLIETFVMNKTQDRESREMFLKLATHLRSLGVKNARSRFESSIAQSEAGNAEWDRREQGGKK